ncbi:hypothetical protein [Leptothrix discophora]|uniref:Uncharacterized protein n=1 Tax=Leptothrix discophora TaxID=89 RepID=A0ABT9FXT3_LEPDI|nr:hypothetical protein [Leptothrix discophora]MDP4299033.1 hypothetical protein [Leptothrix discophora]
MNAKLGSDAPDGAADSDFDSSELGVPDAAGPTGAALSGFGRRALAVLWPAFLMAGVLEMLVFAFVDPQALHWLGGAAVDMDRKAVYSIAFFLFWVVLGLSGAITQLLLREPLAEGELATRRRFP